MNNPEEGEIKQEQQNEEANPEETKIFSYLPFPFSVVYPDAFSENRR